MHSLRFLCLISLFLSSLTLVGQDAVEMPQAPQASEAQQEQPAQPASEEGEGSASGVVGLAAAAATTSEAIKNEQKPSSPVGQEAEGETRKPGLFHNPEQKLEHIEAPFKLEGGIWSVTVFGITTGELTVSFVVLLFAVVFRNIIAAFIFRRLRVLTTKTQFDFDDQVIDALEKPVSWFILFIGIYVSLAILPLDPSIGLLIQNLFHGSTMLLIVWGMLRMTDVVAVVLSRRIKDTRSALFGFIPLLKKTMKAFILCVGLLMVIDNMGYNVAGILTTLGLGGAAIALASKDTVANFFGSLMIVMDRPFKVGDWIMVGDKVDGDVESIGLRSTKVRTWPKTVMSIPNSILANEYINNWSRMPKRRVKQYVGVTYETSAEDMEGIVEDIRKLLREDEGVQQDFILVNFTDFGDSSLDILVYYFTTTTAWIEHMDIRQRINCKIMRAVKDRGLSIAFPTRSLYLEGELARRMAGMNTPSEGASEGRLPGDFGPNAPM
ncbi:mechanosensitive ion channel family protein [Ruficoccus amylovorans]|uniref:Mechanosensitive ion channel family protein n=1 Tax=Ruficoccus amylovorans TaxID=1804625 RepID=A0A842HJ81_9BACT|nr:mechanosensitive ion channel family protein [Ruficoccus amylovorans]MBC2595557.1 mechanosensitive ion channel family protein [Ruficoccus amylovorans]